MKYVKIVAILWGLAYFAVGATKSFTLNSNDTWASVGLLFTVFLLPLPLAIAAVWLPGIAGNLLLACAAASFSFAAAAIVSRHQPSLADIGTFTFFILLYSIPHVFFGFAYVRNRREPERRRKIQARRPGFSWKK